MNLQNATVDKISSMKDGSVKITLVTRELDPTTFAELIMNVNKEVVQIDIPEDSSDTKTPSQRLRGVLYRVWEQNEKDKFSTFELFYRHKTEQLITHFKEQLN